MRVACLFLVVTACLSAVIIAGCSSGEDSDASRKIEELTKQVEALNNTTESDASPKIEELAKQVEALNKAIVINADGIGRFATPTPVPIIDYNQYGFGLPVPSNLEVRAAGLTGPDASNDNGSLLATAGGTSLFLVWSTAVPPLTPEESVIGGFQMLQSLTGVAFEAQGAGAGLTVDSQPGSYATFVTRDAQEEIEGVGIIGGWICPNDERSYAITVTGRDLEPVQQSFVYLTNGFRCEAGSIQTPTPTATPES
jgi:outer membrane murein-binding lipoprotein Lpp